MLKCMYPLNDKNTFKMRYDHLKCQYLEFLSFEMLAANHYGLISHSYQKPVA